MRHFAWGVVCSALISIGCSQGPQPETSPVGSNESAREAAESQSAERRLMPNEAEELARQEWNEYRASMSRAEWLEHLGLSEDPGPSPDPDREFIRFGKRFQIHEFEKKHAVYRGQQLGYVRPFKRVSVVAAIYQDDDESVWVFLPIDEEVEEPEYDPEYYTLRNLSPVAIDQMNELRGEFVDVTPPVSDRTVRFVESSEGLPREGSWRNSPAIADMNEDGFPDIIVPPQRGTVNSVPYIFLGRGDGTWEVWRTVRWPRRLDYGSVDAGDVNGDGHVDLLFGVHLRGLAVFLGDGEGNFTESSAGLPKDSFATRRANLADFDQDGDLDIVALTEGPTKREVGSVQGSKMRIWVNGGAGKDWEQVNLGEPERLLGGDWLAIGRFDEDRYPDLIASSNYFHGTDVLWRTDGEPLDYKVFGRGFFPWNSYISALDAGQIVPGGTDEIVMSYARFWPERVNPAEVVHPEFTRIAGLDLIRFDQGEPQRKRIITWRSRRMMGGVRIGDIDGDGHQDVIYSRTDPRINGVLLGDGAGNFVEAKVEGFDPLPNSSYDLQLADVDLDGRLDVVMIFEDTGAALNKKDGSIRVWLNRSGE